jgi:hypothetical protein
VRFCILLQVPISLYGDNRNPNSFTASLHLQQDIKCSCNHEKCSSAHCCRSLSVCMVTIGTWTALQPLCTYSKGALRIYNADSSYVQRGMVGWLTNWKESPNLVTIPELLTTQNLSQDSQCFGRDSNGAPPGQNPEACHYTNLDNQRVEYNTRKQQLQ